MFSLSPSVHPKSDHERLAQQVCHPEPFGYAQDKLREGSRGQTCPERSRRILRCAQNDISEQLRRKVYQCHAFRFSSRRSSLRATSQMSHDVVKSVLGKKFRYAASKSWNHILSAQLVVGSK